MTYLNHAGTSWPKPLSVVEAVQDVWRTDPAHWGQQFSVDHEQIADFFHVPQLSQLLFAPACTSAIAIAVSDHYWNSGDRILTSGWEHHALHRPLVKLVDQGVDVEVIGNTPDSPFLLDEFETQLSKGKVKLVAITAASNVTGELLPYQSVTDMAHEFGAKVLLDASQIAGWWDISLPEIGADMIAFSGHKGLQGPWGIGCLYMAPDLDMNSPGAVCALNFDKEKQPPTPSVAQPSWCDVGSVDRAALAGLAAGTRWLQHEDPTNRLAHGRTLAEQLRSELALLANISLYGTNNVSKAMPTVAFTVDGLDSTTLALRLQTQGITVAGGLQCAPLAHRTLGTSPSGVVRVSFGPSSARGDVHKLLDAIHRLCAK